MPDLRSLGALRKDMQSRSCRLEVSAAESAGLEVRTPSHRGTPKHLQLAHHLHQRTVLRRGYDVIRGYKMAPRQKLCICNTWIFFPDGRTPHESESQRRHDCRLWKNGRPLKLPPASTGLRELESMPLRPSCLVHIEGARTNPIEASDPPQTHCYREAVGDDKIARKWCDLLAFLAVLAGCVLLTTGFLAWAYSRTVTAQ